jgi:hypothetical protein
MSIGFNISKKLFYKKEKSQYFELDLRLAIFKNFQKLGPKGGSHVYLSKDLSSFRRLGGKL